MSDQVSKIINNIFKFSQNYYTQNNKSEVEKDSRNDLKCLELIDNGWVEDGFDHVEGTQNVITFWKKNGETKHIVLNFAQQQLFVRAVEKRFREKYK